MPSSRTSGASADPPAAGPCPDCGHPLRLRPAAGGWEAACAACGYAGPPARADPRGAARRAGGEWFARVALAVLAGRFPVAQSTGPPAEKPGQEPRTLADARPDVLR
jgi:hypothetical protein